MSVVRCVTRFPDACFCGQLVLSLLESLVYGFGVHEHPVLAYGSARFRPFSAHLEWLVHFQQAETSHSYWDPQQSTEAVIHMLTMTFDR